MTTTKQIEKWWKEQTGREQITSLRTGENFSVCVDEGSIDFADLREFQKAFPELELKEIYYSKMLGSLFINAERKKVTR